MHVGHHLAQPMGMSMPELTVSDHALAYGQISGEFKGGVAAPYWLISFSKMPLVSV